MFLRSNCRIYASVSANRRMSMQGANIRNATEKQPGDRMLNRAGRRDANSDTSCIFKLYRIIYYRAGFTAVICPSQSLGTDVWQSSRQTHLSASGYFAPRRLASCRVASNISWRRETPTRTDTDVYSANHRRRFDVVLGDIVGVVDREESPRGRNYIRTRDSRDSGDNFALARRRLTSERAGTRVPASVLLSGRCLRRFQLAKARLPPAVGRSMGALLRHAPVPSADLEIDRVRRCRRRRRRRRRRRTTPVLGLPPRGATDPLLLAFTPVYRDYPAAALSSAVPFDGAILNELWASFSHS